MNFNKVHRFIRIGQNGELEALDIIPNELKGWTLFDKPIGRLEIVYYDEEVTKKAQGGE